MSITFSTLMLRVNDEPATLDELNSIFTDSPDSYTSDETHYSFEKEILKDRYFWMQIEYGSPNPYPDMVLNTIDRTKEKNLRSKDQAEMNSQLFLLYDANDPECTLYLSNASKKFLVENYLNKRMKGDVVVKNIYINFEKFVKEIETIEEVRWVTRKNVLNLNRDLSDVFLEINDLFGGYVPTETDIRIKIMSPIDSSLENMRKINIFKKNIEATNMVCVGRDDKKVEKVLNHNNYIQKIVVDINKNKKGFYDPASVQQELIKKIEA